MKLITIIEQILFDTYEGMVRVMYKEGESENLAELLRALPGVTTVTNAGSSAEMGAMTFKVKLISQKEPIEAFKSFKVNASTKYSNIIAIKVGEQTIEEK